MVPKLSMSRNMAPNFDFEAEAPPSSWSHLSPNSNPFGPRLNAIGLQSKPTAIKVVGLAQWHDVNGRNRERVTFACVSPPFANPMHELCETQASCVPSGLNPTPWTHPPFGDPYSASNSPNGSRFPHSLPWIYNKLLLISFVIETTYRRTLLNSSDISGENTTFIIGRSSS